MTGWLGTTIKQRILAFLAGLAILSCTQQAATLWITWSFNGSAEFQRQMNTVTQRQMYGDMKHDAIQNDVLRLKDAAEKNDAKEAEVARKSLHEDLASLDETFGWLLAQHYPAALQATIDSARAPEQDYIAKARAAEAAIAEGPAAAQPAIAAFIASFEAFEEVQDKLGEGIRSSIADQNKADDRAIVAIEILLGVIVVIGGGLMALTVVYTRRSVVGPLTRLSGTLHTMAAGDYSEAIDGYNPADEIGGMAEAAQVFRATALAKQQSDREQAEVVAALRAGLQKLADQHLEYRIGELPPAYAELRDTFNSALNSLCKAIGTVRVGAGNLTNSIAEIRAAADDLARRNEQQAANLEETNAAMGQVTQSVQETAVRAGSVRAAMTDAQSEASDGGIVVSQAIEAMAAIEKSTREITQITDLIDGIAFQTNLLALNAGVEAARAGDAGKGFAVVANEVRALAQRSADAARDIKGLIAASTGQVETGVALVGQTGEKLGQIVARVSEITGAINDIASAAQSQAGNLKQVSEAVGEMDKMTQRNAAMVEQTTAATRSLASEARELHAQVATFHTRDASTRPQHIANPEQVRRRSIVESAPAVHNVIPELAAPRPTPRPAASPPATVGNLAVAADADWSEF